MVQLLSHSLVFTPGDSAVRPIISKKSDRYAPKASGSKFKIVTVGPNTKTIMPKMAANTMLALET